MALSAVLWTGCGDDAGATDAATPDAAIPDAAPTADAAPAADAAPPADAPIDAQHFDAVPPAHGTSCDDPLALTPSGAQDGDTSDLTDVAAGSCSVGTGVARDAVYQIDLGSTSVDLVVTAEVDEDAVPPFDAVLYARTDCTDPDSEIGCTDVGWGETLELLDRTGSITVFVDGTTQYGGANHGAYQLTSAVRDIVALDQSCDPAGLASRCVAGGRCQSGSCVADSAELACTLAAPTPADVTATTFAYASDFYQGSCRHDTVAGFPEHIYQLTLAATSDVDATTDFAATGFDTVLYLRRANSTGNACTGEEVACQDDVDEVGGNLTSHLVATDLAAGDYYLFVDGSSAAPGTGTYRLQVTVTPK